jgi:hypothetical protein
VEAVTEGARETLFFGSKIVRIAVMEGKYFQISSEILGALARLEDLKRLPEKEFLADSHKIGIAKYNLIVAIEGAVDFCNHIVAKNGLRTRDARSSEEGALR